MSKGKRRKCALCKADHGVARCQKFLNADLSKRLEIQRINKLCKNCLGINHTAEKCYSFKSCIFCSKDQSKNARHHSLLHNHTTNSNEACAATTSQVSQALLINKEIPMTRTYHTTNSGVNTTTILATAQVRLEHLSILALRITISPIVWLNF